MMTPEEFKRAWEEQHSQPLIVFPPSAFEGTGVSPRTRQFLTQAGLPEAAGPFLMIDSPGSEVLTTASELWELSPEYDDYWVIGSNGSGDPVVICPDDVIVYLNHDDDFAEVYVNRNVAVLAEASLRYPGYEAAASEQARFIEFLERSDPRALQAGSFWSYEIIAWNEAD
jgi:hypothetical protein